MKGGEHTQSRRPNIPVLANPLKHELEHVNIDSGPIVG
jgi:hypothetical protein